MPVGPAFAQHHGMDRAVPLAANPVPRPRWVRLARVALITGALLGLPSWALSQWLMATPMTYQAHQERFGSEQAWDVADELLLLGPLTPVADDVSASDVGPSDIPANPQPMPVVPQVRTEHHETNFDEAESYLIVGVDHTRGAWGRADTIAVAVFDEDSGHAGIVSVPRDLYVTIPNHGPARINATLRIASRQEDVDPLGVLQGVVEEVLSIEIDHVVVGDLMAFEYAVDSLGGLDVHVPCPMIDDFEDSRTDSGRRILDVEAGEVHMDGVTAAMYARSRHGRSDWDRSRRQHAILSALRSRIGEVGFTRWLPVVSGAMERGVVTSMSRLQLLGLLRRVARLDDAKLHGLLIGSRQVEHYRTREGRSVLLPKYDEIDDALDALFSAPPPGVAPRVRRCRPVRAALQSERGRSRRAAAEESSDSAEPHEDEPHEDGGATSPGDETSAADTGVGVDNADVRTSDPVE